MREIEVELGPLKIIYVSDMVRALIHVVDDVSIKAVLDVVQDFFTFCEC